MSYYFRAPLSLLPLVKVVKVMVPMKRATAMNSPLSFSLKNLTEDRFTLALLVICGSFYIVLAVFALKGFG